MRLNKNNMKKTSISLIIVLSLLATPVFVGAESRENPERKTEMEREREEVQERLQEKRTEKQEKIEERKEKKETKLKEKTKENVERILGKSKENLEKTVARLEKLADKVESRIEKFNENGSNVEDSLALLATARAEIEKAKTAVTGINPDNIVYGEIPKDAYIEIKKEIADAKLAIKNSKTALTEVVKSLKANDEEEKTEENN